MRYVRSINPHSIIVAARGCSPKASAKAANTAGNRSRQSRTTAPRRPKAPRILEARPGPCPVRIGTDRRHRKKCLRLALSRQQHESTRPRPLPVNTRSAAQIAHLRRFAGWAGPSPVAFILALAPAKRQNSHRRWLPPARPVIDVLRVWPASDGTANTRP